VSSTEIDTARVLPGSFAMIGEAIDALEPLGPVWRDPVEAKEPPSRGRQSSRSYRVVLHPGADPSRGEQVVMEWLRTLLG
jgi:hypothetical protein